MRYFVILKNGRRINLDDVSYWQHARTFEGDKRSVIKLRDCEEFEVCETVVELDYLFGRL